MGLLNVIRRMALREQLRAEGVESYLQSRGLSLWSADVAADDWKHITAAEVVKLTRLGRFTSRKLGSLLVAPQVPVRNNELEADKLGVDYMHTAGYDVKPDMMEDMGLAREALAVFAQTPPDLPRFDGPALDFLRRHRNPSALATAFREAQRSMLDQLADVLEAGEGSLQLVPRGRGGGRPRADSRRRLRRA